MKFDKIDSIISKEVVDHAVKMLDCVVVSLGKRSQEDVVTFGNIKLLLAILSNKHKLVSTGNNIEVKSGTIYWNHEFLFNSSIKVIRTELDKLSDQLIATVNSQLIDNCDDKDKLLSIINQFGEVTQCVNSNFVGLDKLSVLDKFCVACILADKVSKVCDDKDDVKQSTLNELLSIISNIECVILVYPIRVYLGLTKLVIINSVSFEEHLHGVSDLDQIIEEYI